MNNPSALAREFMQNGKLTSFPIIDAHTHMGRMDGTYVSKANCDEMIEVMNRENVSQIFCSPHSALHDATIMNAELEQAMKKYPDRIKGYYLFNPNYPERYLEHMDDILNVEGYIGFKFLPTYHNYPLDGENYREAFEFADKHSLVILMHTWGHNDPHNAPRHVEMIAKKYKNIKIIMGHSAPGELDEAIKVVKNYDNVYLDLCDIHRHSGIVDKMVENVGADRVLFGTDAPWYDHTYCLGSVLFSHISDEDKYKIIYANAIKLISK